MGALNNVGALKNSSLNSIGALNNSSSSRERECDAEVGDKGLQRLRGVCVCVCVCVCVYVCVWVWVCMGMYDVYIQFVKKDFSSCDARGVKLVGSNLRVFFFFAMHAA